MDDVRNPVAPPSLYEADEYAWYFAQIAALRDQRWDELDRENLAEFLEDVARRDNREIESRFKVLLHHILKVIHQPDHMSKSWTQTILHQQGELGVIFGYSETLARSAPGLLNRAYRRAISSAEAETGLAFGLDPAICPWSVEDVLDFEPPPVPPKPLRQR